MNKTNIKAASTFDPTAFVAALKLPARTFVTVDEKEGFLTVGAESTLDDDAIGKKLEAARKRFQAATAKLGLAEQAALRGLFAPKSSKSASAWCMKCRVKMTMTNARVEPNKAGKNMTVGECPQCGGKLYSFKVDTSVTPIKGTATLTSTFLTKGKSPKATKPADKKVAKEKGKGKPAATGIQVGAIARFYCGKCKAGVDVKVASIENHRAHGKCPACQASIGRGGVK